MVHASDLLPPLALALWLGAAAAANAEIFHCRGADGSVTYTSDPSSCSGTVRHHEPRGEIQVLGNPPRAPGGPPMQPGPAAARPSPVSPEDGQAAMWGRKKREAEEELTRLEGSIDEFQELVSWCNRGGELIVEDSLGLRRDYSCDDARAAFEQMGPRIESLRDYLDTGLAEECRRAGCLPGWIR